MKNYYSGVILVFLLLFAGSCDLAKNNKPRVEIPVDIKKEIDHVFDDGKEMVVVYLLSKEDGAHAAVSKIAPWTNYSTFINNSDIGLVLITNDQKGLKDLNRINYLGTDLYRILDSNNDFFRADGKIKAHIPSTFVLDDEYTTLMVRNPIESSASFESLKKIIASD